MNLLVLLALAVEPATEVWIFTRTDCPIANRYAPAIQELQRKFRLEWKLIYAEPGVTREAIDQHRAEYGLTLPGLADAGHAVKAGATVTPEAAVWVKGRLVYRGRIDDRQATLQSARAPQRFDLRDVLRALASGRTPKPRFTRAIGCALEKL